ncbi:MAG: methylated-DNA--[protein]-cysteine S-methyltransferase [Thermosulfidibacteraceae bacterium]
MENVISTKLGPVSIIWNNDRLESVVLGRIVGSPHKVPDTVMSLFALYFLGKPVDFGSIAIIKFGDDPKGRILEAVRKIGWGETKTYKDIGLAVGIKNYRLVGRILSVNPLPIVIPCHRVVGIRGIGGFSSGVEWKKFLLQLEGVI